MSSRGPEDRSDYPSGLTVMAMACLLELYAFGKGTLGAGRYSTHETQQLYEELLIELDGSVTERGVCLAKAVMAVPLPVKTWTIP